MSEVQPRRRRHVARQWHRWLGMIAALPLLWLSLTGILLNHADRLGLHERQVKSGWILSHYNQMPEGELLGKEVGERLVSTWGGLIFLDDVELDLSGKLVGAVAFKNKLIIATDERLVVMNGRGEMELELDELSLPPLPLVALGTDQKGLRVRGIDGGYRFASDFLSFEKGTLGEVSKPLQLITGRQKEKLVLMLRERNSMPLSRVILDAHSGILFGWPGWVMTDLTALAAIILILLGLRLFPKRQA